MCLPIRSSSEEKVRGSRNVRAHRRKRWLRKTSEYSHEVRPLVAELRVGACSSSFRPNHALYWKLAHRGPPSDPSSLTPQCLASPCRRVVGHSEVGFCSEADRIAENAWQLAK